MLRETGRREISKEGEVGRKGKEDHTGEGSRNFPK